MRVERFLALKLANGLNECFEKKLSRTKILLKDLLNWSSYIEWFVDANKIVSTIEDGT